MIDEKINGLSDKLIEDTQKVLQINSVVKYNENGTRFGIGVTNALNTVLSIAEEMGFKAVNLDNYVGYVEYGEGEDYVAVLGHLDVVPEGNDWIYPPYAAEIHDGKIYARGALDDKGPMMAALYGLKALKDSGIKTTKRVRIIFGLDEENGTDLDMDYYKKLENLPVAGFTPDAEFPIIFAEKGILTFDIKAITDNKLGNVEVISISGGNKANMVPDYCEATLKGVDFNVLLGIIKSVEVETGVKIICTEEAEDQVIVKAHGLSAHGSTPEFGKNAIIAICMVLNALGGTSKLSEYINFVAEKIGTDTTGEKLGVAMTDEPSGALSYNLGILSFDGKNISTTSNVRYPVTYSREDVLEPIRQFVDFNEYEFEEINHCTPLHCDKDSELIKALQNVYKEQVGKEATLIAIGGGTYAKCMPNIVAFGPIFPGKPDLDHQANEYIEIEDLIMCAKIYGNAIYQLAK